MKVTLILLIVALVLYFIFNSRNKSKILAPENKIDEGIYSCETTNSPGYYKLTIKDKSFNFQHIVAIHLPPSILEEVNGAINFIDSTTFKLTPSPKAINEILTIVDKETILLINKIDKAQLKLKKQNTAKNGE